MVDPGYLGKTDSTRYPSTFENKVSIASSPQLYVIHHNKIMDRGVFIFNRAADDAKDYSIGQDVLEKMEIWQMGLPEYLHRCSLIFSNPMYLKNSLQIRPQILNQSCRWLKINPALPSSERIRLCESKSGKLKDHFERESERTAQQLKSLKKEWFDLTELQLIIFEKNSGYQFIKSSMEIPAGLGPNTYDVSNSTSFPVGGPRYLKVLGKIPGKYYPQSPYAGGQSKGK
jgi:hypothetical protein